ncbi:DUF3006 domain-containing protein [Haloplanus pelagicus]|jgi:hypothetical protein|uniref:DUF3006 domain-containing protein n=1 Tax=Haloplanus pelagicus TaxID=2949995 RepID=UPI00203BEEF9|nr:DUF3006 domain-containing protein [Haloplanus sp. HW8-1]
MVDDGTYTAVLDRFEEEVAVLVLESDAETIGHVVVDTETLPAEGQHQDALFTVVIRDDTLTEATYRPNRTEKRRETAQSRFDRLSERSDSEQ